MGVAQVVTFAVNGKNGDVRCFGSVALVFHVGVVTFVVRCNWQVQDVVLDSLFRRVMWQGGGPSDGDIRCDWQAQDVASGLLPKTAPRLSSC